MEAMDSPSGAETVVLTKATRTPTYDYLQRRRAATKRRLRQKKEAVEAKKQDAILKKQNKIIQALQKRLEDSRRENNKLIQQVINLLGLPNHKPDVIQYVKEKLPLLSGNKK